MLKKSEVHVGDVVAYLDRFNDECIGKVVSLEDDHARICDPQDGHYNIDYDDITKKYNEEELPLFTPEHFMEGDTITFLHYRDDVLTGIVTSKNPISLYVDINDEEHRVFYETVLSVGDSQEAKEELFTELERYNQRNWRLYMINVALDKGDKDLFLAMTKELQSA